MGEGGIEQSFMCVGKGRRNVWAANSVKSYSLTTNAG